MTNRQVVGLAVCLALMLGLAFFYWLAPILDYKAPAWVFYVLGPVIPFGWVRYYGSQFARGPRK